MNKTRLLLVVYVFALIMSSACTDIFEKDLSNQTVELLSPTDSLITQDKTQKFWWTLIEGSLWYELQVVSPDFSNTSSVKLDSVLENNNFQLTLQPGVYHWRVRALNGSSSTGYSENTLIIMNSK